jgi:hypothetical protein
LQTFAAPSIAGGRKLNKIKNREVIIWQKQKINHLLFESW